MTQLENDTNSLGSVWRGLGIYLHHISSDNEVLVTVINETVIPKISKIIEELTFLERNLHQEGSTLLGDLKEAIKVRSFLFAAATAATAPAPTVAAAATAVRRDYLTSLPLSISPIPGLI